MALFQIVIYYLNYSEKEIVYNIVQEK